jgi:hypothetical protein
MSTFDLFASDNDTEESGDVSPSAGFGPLDTGILKVGITLAYLHEAASGAMALNLHMKNADGTGNEIKQSLWMTTKKATGQRNSYVDRNGVKHKLPGMEQADNLALLLTGDLFKPAAEAFEEKVVKLWNPATSKEENATVKAVTALMDKPILVGLHKVRDNKMALKDGKYVKLAADRHYNEINKFFDADTGLTVAEKKAKVTDPAWLKKWKVDFPDTYIRDKYEKVADDIADDFAAAGGETTALFP